MLVVRKLTSIDLCRRGIKLTSLIPRIYKICKNGTPGNETAMGKQQKPNVLKYMKELFENREYHAGLFRTRRKPINTNVIEKHKCTNIKKNKKPKKKTKKCDQSSKVQKEIIKIIEPLNENPCKGKKNLAAVLYKKEFLRLEERDKPQLGPGEVLIAMNCVGLSATDVKYFTEGYLPAPLVLGRDGTGVVAEVGPDVTKLREGDRVVVEPNIPCGNCNLCKTCQYHMCLQDISYGIVPHDGLLCCYHKHAGDYCHKLPFNVTMEEGVLMGMLAAGINVCTRCPLCIGSSMLVVGAGPLGLCSLLAAKAMGATNTCVMCKYKERLKLAKLFNTKTVQICEGAEPEDMAQTVREQLGCAPSVTVDSVGTEISMKLALASTASGGCIVMAGFADKQEMMIPLNELANRELTISAALRHSHKYPEAISLASTGLFSLKPLISHHFFLEETTEAFYTLIQNSDTVNRVIIHIRPRDRNNMEPFKPENTNK